MESLVSYRSLIHANIWIEAVGHLALKGWSGRRDSNSRPSPWQGDALPLSHFRIIWSREMDSNHRMQCKRIYSPPPLAARESLEKNWSWWRESNPQPADYKSAALPLSHFRICPLFWFCGHERIPRSFVHQTLNGYLRVATFRMEHPPRYARRTRGYKSLVLLIKLWVHNQWFFRDITQGRT